MTSSNLIDKQLKSLKEKQLDPNIQHLDVSSNQLSLGIDFKPLPNLITLIIDDNLFTTLIDFPTLSNLETFSANKNNFGDLHQFIEMAADKFDQLKNLSLLKNPLNPFFEGEEKYNIYRDELLSNFPLMRSIDGCAVSIMKKSISKQQKEEQNKYQKLEGVAVFDAKYAVDQVKSVKGRSEGNRFLKNEQL